MTHEVTLTVSLNNGVVSPSFSPHPIPNLAQGDDVIWKIAGATVSEVILTVGNNSAGVVKVNVVDQEGKVIPWADDRAGVNIPPPPPPPPEGVISRMQL